MRFEPMLFRTRKPPPLLSEYVDWLWFYEGLFPPHRCERVLPDGSMELIVNLRDEPRHIFDPVTHQPIQDYHGSWISGAHSRFIVIDTAPNSSMIGVHFKPGGASAVLGVPASALQDQVVDLSALFNRAAATLRDQLLDATAPDQKFDVLQDWLVQKWSNQPRPHAAVTYALGRLAGCPDQITVSEVADEVGISRRHFIRRFTEQVGLTPKLFCRVRRFQGALNDLQRNGNLSWVEVAVGAGYYDQSHFIHDFQEFCGLTPTRLAETTVEYPNFVPIFP
jgi:AraC-like DNA-binding protein